jgi:hypothetical protein
MFPLSSIPKTFHENGFFSRSMPLLIYIPVEDISIEGGLSKPSSVMVVLAIVCRALFILDVMLISASVITDANPSTIVKNNRTRFFLDNEFHLIFLDFNIVVTVN